MLVSEQLDHSEVHGDLHEGVEGLTWSSAT